MQATDGDGHDAHPRFAAHFERAFLELVQSAVGGTGAFGERHHRAARGEGIDLKDAGVVSGDGVGRCNASAGESFMRTHYFKS